MSFRTPVRTSQPQVPVLPNGLKTKLVVSPRVSQLPHQGNIVGTLEGLAYNNEASILRMAYGITVNSYPVTIVGVFLARDVSANLSISTWGSSDGANRIQLDVNAGSFRAIQVGGSVGTISTPVSTNKLYRFAYTIRSSTDRSLAVNGILVGSDSTNVTLGNYDRVGVLCGAFGGFPDGTSPLNGATPLLVYLNEGFSNQKLVEISGNPWQLLQNSRKPIFVDIPATGNTSVTKDATASYNIIQLIQKDLAENYNVRTLANKDLVPNYVIRSLIQSDRAVSYNIKSAVNSSISAGYNIQSLIQSSVAPSYVVRTNALSDKSVAYNVRTISTSDSAASYLIRGLAVSDGAFTYVVKNYIQSDKPVNYIIRTNSQSSLAGSYSVRTNAQVSLVETYNVRAATLSSLNCTYDVLTSSSVSKNLVIDYNVRTNTSSDGSYSYSINQSVSSDESVSYTIRLNTNSDLSGTYVVRTVSQKDLVENYNVRGKSISDLPVSYIIEGISSVHKDLSVLYNILEEISPTGVIIYLSRVDPVSVIVDNTNPVIVVTSQI